MDADQVKTVNAALREFGSSLDHSDMIRKPSGGVTSVQVDVHKDRLRFRRYSDVERKWVLIASGDVSRDMVHEFVKRQYFWEKIKGEV